MRADPAYNEGRIAWLACKGERDCPYVDDPKDHESYWESSAGKRQRWMAGFRSRFEEAAR